MGRNKLGSLAAATRAARPPRDEGRPPAGGVGVALMLRLVAASTLKAFLEWTR